MLCTILLLRVSSFFSAALLLSCCARLYLVEIPRHCNGIVLVTASFLSCCTRLYLVEIPGSCDVIVLVTPSLSLCCTQLYPIEVPRFSVDIVLVTASFLSRSLLCAPLTLMITSDEALRNMVCWFPSVFIRGESVPPHHINLFFKFSFNWQQFLLPVYSLNSDVIGRRLVVDLCGAFSLRCRL